jgi:hypothetical protein
MENLDSRLKREGMTCPVTGFFLLFAFNCAQVAFWNGAVEDQTKPENSKYGRWVSKFNGLKL